MMVTRSRDVRLRVVPKTPLNCIAYHCGMRQIEKQKRARAAQAAMVAEQSVSTRGQERHLEDIVEKHERQALVRASLGQLPVHYRLVLILCDYQEMASR